MSNVTVSWDETLPDDPRNAGLGAGDIRSTKTNLRGALDSEHFFPSSGGAAGAHRAGSARAYYGTTSQVSSADTDGRLMVTSNSTRLYHVGSTATYLLGGRYVTLGPSAYTSAGGTNRTPSLGQGWYLEFGTVSMKTTSANTTITFRTSFVHPPIVLVNHAAVVGSSLTLTGTPTPAQPAAASVVIWNYKEAADGTAAAPVEEYEFGYMAAGFIAL